MVELVCIDLGTAAYAPTLRIQERFLRRVISDGGARAYLLLAQHDPPVITLGKSARMEHVLASPAMLEGLGVEIHHVSRGGGVTYHGPGQLMCYPIMSLRTLGVRRYIRGLEEAIIRIARRFGVSAQRQAGLTGVWAGNDKLASIGVAVRKWVAYHGAAINVSPDLSHFKWIVPCGLKDKGVTSLERLTGRAVRCEPLNEPLVECFAEVFGFEEMRWARAAELFRIFHTQDAAPSAEAV